MSELLLALREATRHLHQQLDALPPLQALMQPGLTREAYVRALHLLAQGVRPVEHALAAYTQRHPGSHLFVPEWRWPLLVEDLHAVGAAPPHVPAPPHAPLQVVPSLPFYGGALYVLEGSRLGGQVLARQLQQAEPTAWPCRFFVGSGAHTGGGWKAFQAWMQTCLPRAAQHEAVEGAVWAFGCFLAAPVAAASMHAHEAMGY